MQATLANQLPQLVNLITVLVKGLPLGEGRLVKKRNALYR
jgi:hypothetical protein